jgi:hypothetical protein
VYASCPKFSSRGRKDKPSQTKTYTIQSARHSVQSSELVPLTPSPPHPPHPQGSALPPHRWVQGGRHTRLRGEGMGDTFPTRGQHSGNRYTIIPLRFPPPDNSSPLFKTGTLSHKRWGRYMLANSPYQHNLVRIPLS